MLSRDHIKGHVFHVLTCFSLIYTVISQNIVLNAVQLKCFLSVATLFSFLSFSFLQVWKQFHFSLQTVLFPWCVFMLLHNGSVSGSWAVFQCLSSRIRNLHENKGPSLFLFLLLVTASALQLTCCSLTFFFILIWRWIINISISLL